MIFLPSGFAQLSQMHVLSFSREPQFEYSSPMPAKTVLKHCFLLQTMRSSQQKLDCMMFMKSFVLHETFFIALFGATQQLAFRVQRRTARLTPSNDVRRDVHRHWTPSASWLVRHRTPAGTHRNREPTIPPSGGFTQELENINTIALIR